MLNRLRRDEDGATVVEFAFAFPILVAFIWGIAQFGMIMAADAGMQHALGEGARMATLYPTPSDADIKTRMETKMFGQFLGAHTVATPETSSGTTVGNKYKDLKITYTVTPNFIFVDGPTINFVRTKRVYVAF
jgi:Flp pilus assembly protein TadG